MKAKVAIINKEAKVENKLDEEGRQDDKMTR